MGALVAAGLAMAACGASAASPAPPSTPVASLPPQAHGARPSAATPQALAFTATTVDGAAFNGASLTGKPVVFWFWAPWCTVCRAESPDVAKVAAEFKGKVTFIGIAGLGPVQDMRAFVSQTSTGGFTHLADEDGSLWSRFGVVAQPSFVFVTPDGQSQEFTGGLGADDLRTVASKLLVA
ncbi:MAG: redoxin domain-containing protein [Candidatus Nanopelagicales bacterium]|nr:redoxin domain-containing protein [Candidatus Nanopelagicales bacterium]